MALIRNETRQSVLAAKADVANTSSTRRTGLLKHSKLDPGEGLWIVPCESVHTFFMKFPIDVIFLNRKKQVVKLRENMVRSRIAFALFGHSVVELPVGAIRESGTQVGDQIEIVR